MCHFAADLDLDPDPSFQLKAQNLEKVLKKAHIPYILAFHLKIDADPDPTFQSYLDPGSSGSATQPLLSPHISEACLLPSPHY